LVMSSRDPKLDRHDGGILNVTPLLGVSCLETWLGSPLFSVLQCSPLSKVDLQGCYACHSWRVQDDDFSGPTKFRHLSPLDGALTRRVFLKLFFFGGV
jgi:hypothetical protein